MPFTELIFPSVKPDKASIAEIESNWPRFAKQLTVPNPGLICAFRGWITFEDGQDVRDDFKEFLLFEWNKKESFDLFVGSEQFKTFQGMIRHLLNGPPMLQLYETNVSPHDAAAASRVEIVRVTLEKEGDAVREVMEKMEEGGVGVYGQTINLEEEKVVVGILEDEETADKISSSLGEYGRVSRLVVDISPMPFGDEL
ncbi:hypothetical protein ASPZODRAFT_17357 [Penicilliopsis zonata CBS 506.65]|uniref:ABM domain-containing protein n=1 Tax=Penicilliopsis zonata CBS 506.65 TaxID=1073090 RepID=A0A1L9SFQ1_9EURO|nr:hypothetical protein ASPZODRAFT_17357 [Penicilliopsis zonata CBS 506.65]OJJ45927.1 hypothetical protein ASPZODRAFT_17357 [Penicilliopsis zonata CBS 506.65]